MWHLDDGLKYERADGSEADIAELTGLRVALELSECARECNRYLAHALETLIAETDFPAGDIFDRIAFSIIFEIN